MPKAAPMTPIRRRKLIYSYAPDWALTIVLAAFFFSLDKVDGYRRVFSLEDSSIRHPYAVHERVPNVALYFICFVAPFLIMPIVNFITVRSWWDFHNSSLGLILGLSMTGSLTQIVKITVGRPRPDLLDRCKPPPGLTDPPYGSTDWTVCTQTDNGILRDGFRSFFSGHSSMSFAGLGFLAYYLAGKVHLFDNRGHASKAWLALSPFMAASLVAISRTMDYRHHWQDVLVGSLVGTFFAFFTYRQYYPPLSSELSHRPYSPRIKREDNDRAVLPTHIDQFNGQTNIGNRHQYSDSTDDHFELAGTVPRPPGPGRLENVWKQGAGSPDLSQEDVVAGGSANIQSTSGGAFVPLRNPGTTMT
ncbi:Phospholipid phosphatase 5 [Psilocybe cubensis]|uniref:Phosphatidic acid phosphatase type 2/haloperoxidase domain-containing protein n=2 Tax=Psilocybe cubensis TaxID=181762 RepID=A0A8H8CMZ6_PSICU|nr:Phospholipid phosphatase 5 [Psilocybe cubensis]KAH9483986.1 Phospholipid phosphatase 5 [Psilocybe cubensis]